MRRYIITGTPGCGKTSVIRAVELTGASVVSEAATDLIAFRQAHGDESTISLNSICWTNTP